MQIHNVFHVSLPDPYTPPGLGQLSAEPLPVVVEGQQEYEVNRILDPKRCYRKLHLVQWSGYNYVQTSWELAGTSGMLGTLLATFIAAIPETEMMMEAFQGHVH
jgi:hypothetical protein